MVQQSRKVIEKGNIPKAVTSCGYFSELKVNVKLILNILNTIPKLPAFDKPKYVYTFNVLYMHDKRGFLRITSLPIIAAHQVYLPGLLSSSLYSMDIPCIF